MSIVTKTASNVNWSLSDSRRAEFVTVTRTCEIDRPDWEIWFAYYVSTEHGYLHVLNTELVTRPQAEKVAIEYGIAHGLPVRGIKTAQKPQEATEEQLMDADLAKLRSGQIAPPAVFSDEDLAEMAEEQIGVFERAL